MGGCSGVFPNLSRSHPNPPPPNLKINVFNFLPASLKRFQIPGAGI